MKFKKVRLASLGHFLPENILSSEQIELKLETLYKKLNLPFGRLELMTGIKERRYWETGTRPSDIATEAARDALSKTNLKEKDVDFLIHASVCRDFLEPATSSVVHNNLKLKSECGIFDLSNACLGVMSSIMSVASMIDQGQIKTGLIVSGENSGPLIEETVKFLNTADLNRKNIKEYIANLTIGSAGVAVLLAHEDLCPDGAQILGGKTLTHSHTNHLCQGQGDIHSLMMKTDSEELLKAGVKLASETWSKTKEVLDWSEDCVDWVIGHQVGQAHEQQILKGLGLLDKKKFTTYEHFGNTGSAALPLTLSLLKESDQIKKEETLTLLGIGSGLSCLMLGVRW